MCWATYIYVDNKKINHNVIVRRNIAHAYCVAHIDTE